MSIFSIFLVVNDAEIQLRSFLFVTNDFVPFFDLLSVVIRSINQPNGARHADSPTYAQYLLPMAEM